jgi:hypothetical protein
MKKYIIFIIILFLVFYSKAENISDRHANPNYKNLKVFAKVLERFDESNFYLLQIDILNTGSSTVYFWESTSVYGWIFAFSAVGILFINENERLYFEKKIPNIPAIHEIYKKVSIASQQKYTIKTQFYIYNKEKFLRTNNNFRVIFNFNDANLAFMEDIKQIICEDSIVYKW